MPMLSTMSASSSSLAYTDLTHSFLQSCYFSLILFIDGKQYGNEQYDGKILTTLDLVSYACLVSVKSSLLSLFCDLYQTGYDGNG